MKVILTEDVPNLGQIGAIVSVKDGYARNYLLPRSAAVIANEKNQKELDHRKRVLDRKRKRLFDAMSKVAADIEKVTLTIEKQVGEDERIFGSVTSAEVAMMLKDLKFDVAKKDIELSEDIKKIGAYSASVTLHSEIRANVKVWVVAKSEDA